MASQTSPNFYDGCSAVLGVSGNDPQLCPNGYVSSAVNRFFRYGENYPRLPISTVELEFEDDKQQALFEGGNFQGAYFYNSYPSFDNSSIITSIAGTIFRIQITGGKGVVTTLFTGHDPVLTHSWMAQGMNWLVIQNGFNQPILWDGTNPARFAVAGDKEVPKGSVMAFIHGRLVVADAAGTNQIAVGDIIYGNHATTTDDVISFTETDYWAEGGSFGAPVYVGNITGMYGMPYLDTGTGQNELVVTGTEGAVSLDLSIPREQWLNTQILRISQIGGGNVSSHSLAGLNGDLFFRSAEGIRSYRNARAEFQQTWRATPISLDVRRWLSYDSRPLLQYCSQVAWNNLLLCTCSPMIAAPNNPFAGFHRYHRGFVVMDAEPQSTSSQSGAPMWQGVWTGIRPTQFVEGRIFDQHRCFAFSYDRDGRNRLYEIKREGFQDAFYGSPRSIFSFFDTGLLGQLEETTNFFEPKNLLGGEIQLSNIKVKTDVEISVRVDSTPCFDSIDNFEVGCDCSVACPVGTQPPTTYRVFQGPDRACATGTGYDLQNCRHWQGRIAMAGWAKMERMAFRFSKNQIREKTVNCVQYCQQINCCPDADDYSYHIAPVGTNTNVPDIPAPSDAPPTAYVATKSYTAVCPDGTSYTSTQTASSTVSQAAADELALASAIQQAQANLNCFSCAPSNIANFTANNSSVDLSAYFTVPIAPGNPFSPWRLIDAHTLTVYASGAADAEGTLQIAYALQTGNDTFDPVTFTFTDSSDTTVLVYLQVGCAKAAGNPDFPPFQPY